MIGTRDRLLSDKFDIKGFWFLEASSQEEDIDHIPGVLRYEPDRIRLELIGTFGQNETSYTYKVVLRKETKRVNRIFGYSDKGEEITLFDCLPIQEQTSFPGFSTITYSVGMMYVGCMMESENECPKTVSFSYTNLDAWVQHDVIMQSKHGNVHSITFDMDEAKNDLTKITIPEIGCSLSEETRVITTQPNDYTIRETLSVSAERFYHLCSLEKETISVKDYFEIVHSIKRLVTLLVGKPMYIKYIDFQFKENDGKAISEAKRCRLFFSQIGDTSNVESLKPYNPRSFLIRYSEIGNIISDVFNNWFSKIDCFDETIRSFINGKYLPEFLENSFLNVARGLEAHHRFFIETSEMKSKDKYLGESEKKDKRQDARDIIVGFINENTPEEYREFFIKRIEYDEINYRTRLKSLIEGLPSRLQSKIFGGMNSRQKSAFVQSIIDTRNYYTHRDNINKYPHAITEPHSLHLITKKLSAMLQYYSYIELGIEDRITEKAILDFIDFEV